MVNKERKQLRGLQFAQENEQTSYALKRFPCRVKYKEQIREKTRNASSNAIMHKGKSRKLFKYKQMSSD